MRPSPSVLYQHRVLLRSSDSIRIRTDHSNLPLPTALGPPVLSPPPIFSGHQPFNTLDHSARQLPQVLVPGRPRGHTVADALSGGVGSNKRKLFSFLGKPSHRKVTNLHLSSTEVSILEGIPRAVYNPPPDFLQRSRTTNSHFRTSSSSSLPNGELTYRSGQWPSSRSD